VLTVKTHIGPSPLHGIGLFADEFIPKGAPVWRFVEGFDVRVAPEVVEQLSDPAKEQLHKYSYRDEESGFFDLCADDARFFNHSDAPNTMSLLGEVDVASRDILAGEELTCDYRVFDPDWGQKLVGK
jgi:uncharacterized protein